MVFQIFLDHEPAHRMADQNGRSWELPHCGFHVIDVVHDPRPAQTLRAIALTVSAHIHRVRREPVMSEVIEKVDIPAPGPVQRTVDKKQGRRAGIAAVQWIP